MWNSGAQFRTGTVHVAESSLVKKASVSVRPPTMSDLLRVKIRGRGPPGDFRFVFREDGHRVKVASYDAWLYEINQHYKRNGYAQPENWAELAEDQLCKMLPPGECMYGDGSVPEFFVNLSMTLDDVIRGTKVLASWATSGFALVDPELAESRAATCASCYANVPIPGCASCTSIMTAVTDAVGGKQVKSEPLLHGKSCAYCHCASSANVWVPIAVSQNGVDDRILQEMPSYCWKKKSAAEGRDV